MPKLIYNGMEIADVTYSSGGSGGGLPTFTDTTIATGTSAGTLTFTDDFHDYDLLLIKCVNTGNSNETELLVSPDLLDSIFDIGQNIVCNEYQNNIYCTYRKTSSTEWQRVEARSLYISEVIGLVCDNYTITETELYNRGSYGTSSVTISGTDFLDYDFLLIASSVDGIQPNSVLNSKPVFVDSIYRIVVTPYSQAIGASVADTEISSAPYHYVGGIKFT